MQSFLPTVFARRTVGRAQVPRRTSWAQVGADVGHLRGGCCQRTRLHIIAGEPGRLANVPGALTLSSRGLGEGMAGSRLGPAPAPAPAQPRPPVRCCDECAELKPASAQLPARRCSAAFLPAGVRVSAARPFARVSEVKLDVNCSKKNKSSAHELISRTPVPQPFKHGIASVHRCAKGRARAPCGGVRQDPDGGLEV
jgi:hypothetical protein